MDDFPRIAPLESLFTLSLTYGRITGVQPAPSSPLSGLPMLTERVLSEPLALSCAISMVSKVLPCRDVLFYRA